MDWLVLLLLTSFPLGQLTRLEIYPSVQFYLHDLAIFLICVKLIIDFLLGKKLKTGKLFKPTIAFFIVALVSLFVGVTKLNFTEAIIGFLYLLRWLSYFGVYIYILNRSKLDHLFSIAKSKI